MTTYWTQQGCYITYASQVSSKEQGFRTIIGEPCSTRVGDIIGNDAYIALYAIMIPFNVVYGALSIYRFYLSIAAARKKNIKLWEHEQARLYFLIVSFRIVYFFWCLDPLESLGIFGQFGGNFILRVVILIALYILINVSTRVWIYILTQLLLIQFSKKLIAGFYIVFALLAIFGILPIDNSLVRGMQYLLSYAGFLVVGIFNMYYGFKVLQKKDEIAKANKQITRRSTSMYGETPSSTTTGTAVADSRSRKKIVLATFGISSQFFMVFLVGSSLGFRYLFDAVHGIEDLDRAVVITGTQIKLYYLIISWLTIAGANISATIILYAFAKVA